MTPWKSQSLELQAFSPDEFSAVGFFLSLMLQNSMCYQQASCNLHLFLFCLGFLAVESLHFKQCQRDILIGFRKRCCSHPSPFIAVSSLPGVWAVYALPGHLWKFRHLSLSLPSLLDFSTFRGKKTPLAGSSHLLTGTVTSSCSSFSSSTSFCTPVFQPKQFPPEPCPWCQKTAVSAKYISGFFRYFKISPISA